MTEAVHIGVINTLINRSFSDSPAYIYSIQQLLNSCGIFQEFCYRHSLFGLYSVKALSQPDILKEISNFVAGYSVSSVYEAKNASEFSIDNNLKIHLVTPLILERELIEIRKYCSKVTFNSHSQYAKFGPLLLCSCELGIRVNTGISLVENPKYDPADPETRLGIPIEEAATLFREGLLSHISGIHFHTNCESENLDELGRNINSIIPLIQLMGAQLKWVNLGGGYYFDPCHSSQEFDRSLQRLNDCLPAVEIYIEPGTDIVQDCGFLLSTVQDVIKKDSRYIAVLDSSINHLPEVFEFSFLPEVFCSAQTRSDIECIVELAGRTCLAGDIFGQYEFPSIPRIDDKVLFFNAGSYAQVKATTFNGIPLPSSYLLTDEGNLKLSNKPGYEDWIKTNS